MWSTTTVVGSAVKKSHSSGRSTRLEVDRPRASRAARCGAAISSSSSFGVKSTSRLTKLKRTPRTPASCMRLQLGVGDAAPHGGDAARLAVASDCSASTIARLSAPWQVACTITLRAKPRWSRSANSCALLRVAGVYLRSGANGNCVAGAEHVAVRVDAAGRQPGSAACSGRRTSRASRGSSRKPLDHSSFKAPARTAGRRTARRSAGRAHAATIGQSSRARTPARAGRSCSSRAGEAVQQVRQIPRRRAHAARRDAAPSRCSRRSARRCAVR